MEYRRFGNDYVIRFQKGEDIVCSMMELCRKEGIRLGSVSGLGATNEVTLGVFNTAKQQYEKAVLTGDFEITSCIGNVSTMNGETYLHLHMNVADPVRGIIAGGHLNRAVISLTGEFFIHAIDGTGEREFSPEVGLNLFKFI